MQMFMLESKLSWYVFDGFPVHTMLDELANWLSSFSLYPDKHFTTSLVFMLSN